MNDVACGNDMLTVARALAIDATLLTDNSREFERVQVAGDWPAWRRFREMRNIASHSYDEAKALKVAAAIPDHR